MTEREADEALHDAELVPLMKGSLPDLKKVREQCLDQDVPVAMGCPDGKSCGATTHLLVREADIPRVSAILRSEWQAMLEREGTGARVVTSAMTEADVDDDAELPCPACGTRAALVEGACSDCGLVLE